ncbi:EscU/YscU/HrcU family type III secretion system export apparatus switch protein [Photobacterium leiognathi]|uniref:EscU/YscU/HrcU family type III secretion system export apparatus switch protein n=1 Tax=Photobacterium leiognathi TaxID=553611 RepID=UPI002982082D|nr:EscU/YscU/HrcU family type III secretion system export apparatus switch protein [Photobacterium leiognathi]
MSTEEKTEKATEHKLREARKKGQISKSMDITGMAGIAVALITIMVLAQQIGQKMMAATERIFLLAPEITPGSNPWLIGQVFQDYLSAVMPVLMLSMIVGIMFNLFQTKGNFSTYPLIPDIKKLNPIKGFKKLISIKSLFELVKSLLRLSAISVMAYYIFYEEVIYLPDVMSYSLPDILERILWLLVKTIAFFMLIMIPFTMFDVFFQNWSFAKEMRMSKKEVKDEYKGQEGDPEIKQKRKQMQKEVRDKTGSLSNVPSADFVITNPTFIAIALKYDSKTMLAPKVVSKGKGPVAKKIREIAHKNNLMIKSDIPLAREIYKTVKINSEIPPELYGQVADIYRGYFKSKENKMKKG